MHRGTAASEHRGTAASEDRGTAATGHRGMRLGSPQTVEAAGLLGGMHKCQSMKRDQA